MSAVQFLTYAFRSLLYGKVKWKLKGISMPSATVTSKGQITIPIEVRQKLGLDAGDRIDFFEGEKGEYVIRPKTGSIMEMRGILKKLGYAPLDHVPSIEEMDRDVQDHAAELDAATLSTGKPTSKGGETR
jgi:antitoxin PrlF